MKNKFFALLVVLLYSISGQSQKSYTGKFRVIGPNAENAAIYTNEITIIQGTETSISLHFRGGSRTEPDDYIDLSGTINGTMEGGRLDASGSVAAEMKDGPRLKQEQKGITILGTLNANKIEGKVYMGPVNSGAFLDFTATSSELKPALTYPVGASPKVFDKGWVFGASFTITDDDGNEIDLSDKVEWNGTATFNPGKGKTSHPIFNSIGKNKITLTVKYENKTYKGDYDIVTVDVNNYAHVGSLAMSPADRHGCPACPHPVIGPIMMGSPVVFINGEPAARVGDMGTHVACCDGNYFTITTGDNEVMIDGKAAARFGLSQTSHCGSMGEIVRGQKQGFVQSNKDVNVSNNGIQKEGETNLSTDDEVTTGPKGIMSFSNGPQTVVTIFPSTTIKVMADIPEQIKLLIKYGALMADGNTISEKKILIELKSLSVKPKGTKFYVITDSLQSTISVFRGKVTVTDKTTGISNDVDSGFSYHYANSKAEIIPLTDGAGEETQRKFMATVDNSTIKTVFKDNNEATKTERDSSFSLKTFLRENILFIATGIVALAVVIVLIVKKKRSKA